MRHHIGPLPNTFSVSWSESHVGKYAGPDQARLGQASVDWIRKIERRLILGGEMQGKLSSAREQSHAAMNGQLTLTRYYILRDDMLGMLVQAAVHSTGSQSCWQVSVASAFGPKSLPCEKDIEAILHCIRYSAEGVPLGEDKNMPILFSRVLGHSRRGLTVAVARRA